MKTPGDGKLKIRMVIPLEIKKIKPRETLLFHKRQTEIKTMKHLAPLLFNKEAVVFDLHGNSNELIDSAVALVNFPEDGLDF